MARIAGVDLPREKRIEIGLTYIYGIGRTSSSRILAAANVNPDTRVRDLTDDEVKRISAVIDETQLVEGERSLSTSRDFRRSDAIVESVTEKVFRFVDRRQRQTLEHVRVQSAPLQIRKNKVS